MSFQVQISQANSVRLSKWSSNITVFHLPSTTPPNKISPPCNYRRTLLGWLSHHSGDIFCVVFHRGKAYSDYAHTQKKTHFPLCIISQKCEMQNHCIHNGLDSFQLMVVWRERAEGDVLQIHSALYPCVEWAGREFINGTFNCYSSPPRHPQIC